MNRLDKGLRAALKAARCSQFHSHRVGASVFDGPKLISTGCNKRKSHPKNASQWSCHAEFTSLIRYLDANLSNAILYVARLTRTGKVSCAKPCKTCQEFISKLKIKRVFYTNHQGILEKLS